MELLGRGDVRLREVEEEDEACAGAMLESASGTEEGREADALPVAREAVRRGVLVLTPLWAVRRGLAAASA